MAGKPRIGVRLCALFFLGSQVPNSGLEADTIFHSGFTASCQSMNYVSNSQLKHSLGMLATLFQIFPVLVEEICVSHLNGLKVKIQSHSVLFGDLIQRWSTEDTDGRAISAFLALLFSQEVKNLESAPSLPIRNIGALNWGHS